MDISPPYSGSETVPPAQEPSGLPPDPHTSEPVNPFDTTTDIDAKVEADEAEQQRLRDMYRMQHPGDTTAGAPAPTTAGAFFDTILTFGHKQET